MQTSKVLNIDKHQLKSFGIDTKLETHSKYLRNLSQNYLKIFCFKN